MCPKNLWLQANAQVSHLDILVALFALPQIGRQKIGLLPGGFRFLGGRLLLLERLHLIAHPHNSALDCPLQLMLLPRKGIPHLQRDACKVKVL